MNTETILKLKVNKRLIAHAWNLIKHCISALLHKPCAHRIAMKFENKIESSV